MERDRETKRDRERERQMDKGGGDTVASQCQVILSVRCFTRLQSPASPSILAECWLIPDLHVLLSVCRPPSAEEESVNIPRVPHFSWEPAATHSQTGSGCVCPCVVCVIVVLVCVRRERERPT